MRKARWLVLASAAVAAIALTVAVSGCASKGSTSQTTDPTETKTINSTFNAGLNGEVTSLDPVYLYDWTSCPVMAQYSEALMQFSGPDDELAGWLATGYEQVDDLTYVYQIHDNVTFWDGTPMTMEDVLFSLKRHMDPDVGSYLAWMFEAVDTIEQTGDWELTVKLKEPDATFKYIFATSAGHVHQKAAIEAAGTDYGTAKGGVMATGAYKFVEWQTGVQLVFEYNENYWNKAEMGEPDIKKLVYQNIEEDATRSMAVKSGQIDVDFWVPTDKVEEMQSADNLNTVIIPGPTADYLVYNTQVKPLDDVNFRRALSAAIDIENLQENVIKQGAAPSTGITVPTTLYKPDKAQWEDFASKVTKYTNYDLTAAKSYLAQSAYPDGTSLTLTVDKQAISNSLALYLQQAFKELNVDLKIEKVSYEELIGLLLGDKIQKDGTRPYQILMGSWAADFPDPSGVLIPIYASGNRGEGGSNSAEYTNKIVDDALDKQATLSDDAERAVLMQKAIEQINEDVPYYVYSHTNYIFAVNKERVASGFEDLGAMWTWKPMMAKVKLSK
ncbi:MAG: ABC transporter substrate-binding protein [Actinomycetes bacterium]|jgi:peptide/nickel transport system substrate-binding protein|nr:ABC transporter substrate-binding protein [Actinomycetes bacterium]